MVEHSSSCGVEAGPYTADARWLEQDSRRWFHLVGCWRHGRATVGEWMQSIDAEKLVHRVERNTVIFGQSQ